MFIERNTLIYKQKINESIFWKLPQDQAGRPVVFHATGRQFYIDMLCITDCFQLFQMLCYKNIKHLTLTTPLI